MNINYQKFRYILFPFLLLLAACGSESSSPTAGVSDSDTSFLTATINGKEFSSSLEIITLKISGNAHLYTADNRSGVNEYEIGLINPDGKGDSRRYGSIELKNNGEGKKDKAWMVPSDFNYSITADTEHYIEGTFSFTAKDNRSGDELVVTDGEFRANKTGGY